MRMHLKDYYAILEIETSASATEIKKSYRRLAQQFHPDKNQADPYAVAQFHQIKEAYEVLTNPSRKEYYLQQRWYNQSIGKKKTQDAITPVTVLKQSLELEKYVSTLDIFRMDKEGLEQYILELLSNDTINKLKQFNEPDTSSQIVQITLRTINVLPPHYSKTVLSQLQVLAESNENSLRQIQSIVIKTNKKHQREKYSLLIIIGITIILCLLIFLAGR
ncbi:MAG: DnaJ domain-containing protein [Chitinophagaceae bacterium]|nr:DnaJ domain-containing protein [Chitinophagaceae bacterium]